MYGQNIIQRPYNGPSQYVAQNMQQQRRPQPRTIYSHKTTKNKSFLDMHHYLKSIGVKNNEFMLALIDPDLENVDPFDPHLNAFYKQKILRECICNYWYFIRCCVRIPTSNGTMAYKLTRANLALNFCMALNLNIFFEVNFSLTIMVTWWLLLRELLENAKVA